MEDLEGSNSNENGNLLSRSTNEEVENTCATKPPPPVSLVLNSFYALVPMSLWVRAVQDLPPSSPCDLNVLRQDDGWRLAKGMRVGVDFEYLESRAAINYLSKFKEVGPLRGNYLIRRCERLEDGSLRVDNYPHKLKLLSLPLWMGEEGVLKAQKTVTLLVSRLWTPPKLLLEVTNALIKEGVFGDSLSTENLLQRGVRMWILPKPGEDSDVELLLSERVLLANKSLGSFLEAQPGRENELEGGESRVALEIRKLSGIWPTGDTTRAVRAYYYQRSLPLDSFPDPDNPLSNLRDHRGNNEELVEMCEINKLPSSQSNNYGVLSYVPVWAKAPTYNHLLRTHLQGYGSEVFPCLSLSVGGKFFSVTDVQPSLDNDGLALSERNNSILNCAGMGSWRSLLRVGDSLVTYVADNGGEKNWRPAWVTGIDHSLYPPLLTLTVLMSPNLRKARDSRPRLASKNTVEARFITGYKVSLESNVLSHLYSSRVVNYIEHFFEPAREMVTVDLSQVPKMKEFVRLIDTVYRPKELPPITENSDSVKMQRREAMLSTPKLAPGVLPTLHKRDWAPPPAPETPSMTVSRSVEEYKEFVMDLKEEFKTTRYSYDVGVGIPGVVGLRNLGNTCFMNSILQCLASVEDLTSFFLSDDLYRDINPENKLGSGGGLALGWAAFLTAVWDGSSRTLSPGLLKDHVSRSAPHFLGDNQHDSEDFLRTMLDWLLEDTCRVRGQKPTFPSADTEGGGDVALADRAWTRHLSRNASKVTDVFFGQFRSRLTCNVCGTTTTTFDPFSSLPLAIPPPRSIGQLSITIARPGSVIPAFYAKLFFDAYITGPLTVAQITVWAALHLGTQIFGGESKEGGSKRSREDERFAEGKSSFFVTESIAEEAKSLTCKSGKELPPLAILAQRFRAYASLISMQGGGGSQAQQLVFHRCYSPASVIDADVFDTGFPHKYTSVDGPPKHFWLLACDLDAEISPRRSPSPFIPQDPRTLPPPIIAYFNPCWTIEDPNPQCLIEKSYCGDVGFSKSVESYNRSLLAPAFLYIGAREDRGTPDEKKSEGGEGELVELRTALKSQALSVEPSNTGNNTSSCGRSSTNADVYSAVLKAMAPRLSPRPDGSPPFFNIYVVKPSCLPDGSPVECFLEEKTPLGSFKRLCAETRRLLPKDTQPFQESAFSASLVVLLPRDVVAKEGLGGGAKHESESCGVRQETFDSGVSLADCLKHFSTPETLSGEERIECSHCKMKQEGTKVLSIWRAPPVLTVHLKRFKTRGFPGAMEFLCKVDTFVDYPVEGLDLGATVVGPREGLPPVYDLFAVSEHLGSFSFGHYTARVKHMRSGKWYLMNDECASTCMPRDVVNQDSYVLFYRLRDSSRAVNTQHPSLSPPPRDEEDEDEPEELV